jgi:transcription elongation factor GreA
MNKFPITTAGFAKIQEELKDYKTVQRPEIIKAIAEARENGDLSENADYQAARERQSFIEGKILELEDKIARAEVIEPTKLHGEIITFGATVTIIDLDNEVKKLYKIVGEYEADLNLGMISISSPIARALIGKKVGDVAEVSSPGGVKEYEILKLEYLAIEL